MTTPSNLELYHFANSNKINLYAADFKYPAAVGSLEPDIRVPFTFDDYKSGIDTSLTSIMSIESSN